MKVSFVTWINLAFASVFLFLNAAQVSAQCCTGYAYSQEITISNPNSSILTNFQVEFLLNTQALVTAGKMRTDGNDIYVVDANCNPLSFWIEDNSFNSDKTNFWVKVPTVAASGNTSVYLVYGKPSASSPNPTRNGDQTFVFFDDFNTGTVPNTSKWTFVNNTGSGSPSISSSGYFTFTANPSPNLEVGLTHPMTAGNYEIGAKVFVLNQPGRVDGDPGIGWFPNTISRTHVVAGWSNDDEGPLDAVWANGGSIGFPVSNPTQNRWSFVRLRLLGNQTQARHFGHAPLPAFDASSGVLTATSSAITKVFVGAFAYQGNPVRYDFFFVRNATSNEPTVTPQAEIPGPPMACSAVAPVPTLSQWGLILLALFILNYAAIVLWRQKQLGVASRA
ncbi:MAG TPA: IPTL-CTERM sorting domain-containing protein [Bacteroidetes bacterium]|nr:IPTL-CTERM sorting domain-containing protein [Bacteroidota bacterium]